MSVRLFLSILTRFDPKNFEHIKRISRHCSQIPLLHFRGMVLAFIFSSSAPVLAENITYPAPNSPPLQSTPGGVGPYNLLGPSGSSSGKSYSISGNVITVNGNLPGVSPYYVIGGLNGNDWDAVTYNTVIINNNTSIEDGVYGGYAIRQTGSVTASNNQVFYNDYATMSSPYTIPRVIGGHALSENGSAATFGNSVTISSRGNNDGTGILNNSGVNAYGGWAQASITAQATGNNITISNNAKFISVTGGYAQNNKDNGGSAIATGNTATNNNARVNNMTGGYAQAHYGGTTKNASNNTAILINGTVDYTIVGGRTLDSHGFGGVSEASGNAVRITGGTVGMHVVGGLVSDIGSATADGNTVDIHGNTTVGGSVFGGSASGAFDISSHTTLTTNPASGTIASASGNIVNISGSTVSRDVYGGYAYGSRSANVMSNAVNISSGTVGRDVYGGYAHNSSNGIAGTTGALGNTVTISGGVVEGIVYGGSVNNIATGTNHTGTATAQGNTVVISGGVVRGIVYGGHANITEGNAVAGANRLIITGGTLTGNIYGGYAYSVVGEGVAENNEVTISGSPDLRNASIYGGLTFSGVPGTARDFAGNTFNLHSAGVEVAGLHNFQNLRFYVPPSLNTGGTMLYVTGTADITNTTVAMGFDGSHQRLYGGDYFVLVNASDRGPGTLVGVPENHTIDRVPVQVPQGSTLYYTFDVMTSPPGGQDQLWAILPRDSGGPFVTPGTECLAKGFIMGVSMLNQGADLIAGWGTSEAVGAARQAADHDRVAFGALSHTWLRHKAGCHTDLSNISMMTGLARRIDYQSGNLVLGPFLEYGDGSYDTYTDARGSGDIRYLGGGVVGRMDFTNNFYAEASVRGGVVKNEHRNKDLRNFVGHAAKYDASSGYYGLHAGAGYIWKLTDKTSLDLNGKFLWTHVGSDSVRLSTGETLNFDSANSRRLRGGTRINHAVNEKTTLYAGAAYEREFSAKAFATTNGHSIDVPSLKGNTAIGELGLTRKPSERPLFLDLSVQGHAGKREGVTGTFRIRYDF
jgi:hypothetical protein